MIRNVANNRVYVSVWAHFDFMLSHIDYNVGDNTHTHTHTDCRPNRINFKFHFERCCIFQVICILWLTATSGCKRIFTLRKYTQLQQHFCSKVSFPTHAHTAACLILYPKIEVHFFPFMIPTKV